MNPVLRNLLLFIGLFGILASACNLLTPAPAPTATLPEPTFLVPASPSPSPTGPGTIPSPTGIASVAPTTAAPTPTIPPLPTVPPTTAPTPAQATPASQLSADFSYAAILVEQGDELNVRSGPGTENTIIATLPPTASAIRLTGNQQTVDGNLWVEINLSEGGTGWVLSDYLTEFVPVNVFCSDSRVQTLFDDFSTALAEQDGNQLAALISPRHGLDIHFLRDGNIANYSQEEARFLFDSTYKMDWGTHPASGMEITGSFHEVVLPSLTDVFGRSYEPTCSDIRLGGANYMYAWPFRYTNINFYSLLRPGTPGMELDWHTWLAGIEYVDNQPYLFSLLNFFWEP